MEDPNLISSTSVPAEQRSLALWMHLTPLVASVVNLMLPIPFLSVIATTIIYTTQKDKGEFVRENGRESLNFQITLALVIVALLIMMAVAFGSAFITLFTGGQIDNDAAVELGAMGALGSGMLISLLFIVIGIGGLILMIIASIRANEGKIYRYPISAAVGEIKAGKSAKSSSLPRCPPFFPGPRPSLLFLTEQIAAPPSLPRV